MSENIKECKNYESYEEYKDCVIKLCEEDKVDTILEELNNSKEISDKEEVLKKLREKNIEDCLNYDFSNDGASKNYIELYDQIEKYYIYRIVSNPSFKIDVKDEKSLMKKGKDYIDKKKKEGYKCDDPDSNSKILQEIYSVLWNEENLKECISKGNIQGDTMNSVGTTMMQLFECGLIEKEKSTKRQKGSIRYQISRYADEEDREIKTMETKLKEIDNLENFLSLYHTLGNFIPFPVDCNGLRGFGITEDYWDLTLKIIYNYYKEKDKMIDNSTIEEIGKVVNSATIIAFIKWLNSFEKWDNFVEKNYMQDFVEKGSEQDVKYGKPLELWKGHFKDFERDNIAKVQIDKSNLTKEEQQEKYKEKFKEFYSNISILIECRSIRMLSKLYKELKEEY